MLTPSPSLSPILSPEQFARLRRLALKLAGIELVERHRELLDRRARRRGVLDDSDAFDEFLTAAEKGDPDVTQQLLCLLTTKFTGFFRHPEHFEQAAICALERGRARIWSAAAATGEEPYSLAMAMIEAFERDDPPIEILATDVDVESLAAAARGVYSIAALDGLGSNRRGRFFERSSVITPVRRLVEFRSLNLAGADWDIQGPFDVIFCRNVLMYLEASHREAALGRIASLLAPDGLLMLDPAEHLTPSAARRFAPVAAGVYQMRAAA
jgi:chemotaxis protein methyltransferase CheR